MFDLGRKQSWLAWYNLPTDSADFTIPLKLQLLQKHGGSVAPITWPWQQSKMVHLMEEDGWEKELCKYIQT